MTEVTNEKKYTPWIIAAGVVIPLVVGILAVAPKIEVFGPFNYYIFPFLNAIINGTTFLVLVAGLIAIKKKNIAVIVRTIKIIEYLLHCRKVMA